MSIKVLGSYVLVKIIFVVVYHKRVVSLCLQVQPSLFGTEWLIGIPFTGFTSYIVPNLQGVNFHDFHDRIHDYILFTKFWACLARKVQLS